MLLYGEVQKEVIAATPADVCGVEASFAPSQIMYVERPAGVGTALDFLGRGSRPRRPRTDGIPFDRVEYMRFLARRNLATSAS